MFFMSSKTRNQNENIKKTKIKNQYISNATQRIDFDHVIHGCP